MNPVTALASEIFANATHVKRVFALVGDCLSSSALYSNVGSLPLTSVPAQLFSTMAKVEIMFSTSFGIFWSSRVHAQWPVRQPAHVIAPPAVPEQQGLDLLVCLHLDSGSSYHSLKGHLG
jgi:hypothetical protein